MISYFWFSGIVKLKLILNPWFPFIYSVGAFVFSSACTYTWAFCVSRPDHVLHSAPIREYAYVLAHISISSCIKAARKLNSEGKRIKKIIMLKAFLLYCFFCVFSRKAFICTIKIRSQRCCEMALDRSCLPWSMLRLLVVWTDVASSIFLCHGTSGCLGPFRRELSLAAWATMASELRVSAAGVVFRLDLGNAVPPEESPARALLSGSDGVELP